MAIAGMEFLDGLNVGAIMDTFFGFVSVIVIFLFIAGIIGVFVFLRNKKKQYSITIHIFEEQNGDMIPIGMDKAMEFTIPDSDIKVFHLEKNKLYLPRGKMRMGKDNYWYAIADNREWINWKPKSINKALHEAEINFNHDLARLQYVNMTELIKRNYHDKHVKFWKEYKDVISTVIYVFVIGLAFFFLLGKVEDLIGTIQPLLETMKETLEVNKQVLQLVQQVKSGSGAIVLG